MGKYRSSKTYGHNEGLSCVFRQHRAESHCNRLHGYALKVHIEFAADTIDARNWVVDFGNLKRVKEWLKAMFDHKVLVAKDDPQFEQICMLEELDLADVNVVDATGCEAFAEMIHHHVNAWLKTTPATKHARVHHVRVSEHGANSAAYYGDDA